MDLAAIRSQLTTLFMVRSSVTHPSDSTIALLFQGLFLLVCLEGAFKVAPTLLEWFRTQKTAVRATPSLPPSSDPQTSSITLVRSFNDSKRANTTDNAYVERVDAVIDYISNLDSAQHIRMDTRCSIINTREIQLTQHITAKVREIQSANDVDPTIEIHLSSPTLQISELRRWIDEVHTEYMFEKTNRLGSKIYYFDEIPVEPPKMLDPHTKQEAYRMDQAPKHLVFAMNEFHTTKSFNNIYGTHVAELRERLDLFTNHPEWYAARGIPHSLGILLHGKAGAGKTSTIKAIANDTNRHIFNLRLRPYTTQKQLTSLFYNETITVTVDGTPQTYRIPLNRRVYVIEDIDCLTDVVLDRELYTAEDSPATAAKSNDTLTLSFLLNLLDGVLETPGRILVITSNYPDRLDRALIRPGRIDVRLEFTNASREFILEMCNRFYNTTLAISDIPVALDTVFTPAEIMESFCANFKNPLAAIAHLQQRLQKPMSARASTMLAAVPELWGDEPEPGVDYSRVLTPHLIIEDAVPVPVDARAAAPPPPPPQSQPPSSPPPGTVDSLPPPEVPRAIDSEERERLGTIAGVREHHCQTDETYERFKRSLAEPNSQYIPSIINDLTYLEASSFGDSDGLAAF